MIDMKISALRSLADLTDNLNQVIECRLTDFAKRFAAVKRLSNMLFKRLVERTTRAGEKVTNHSWIRCLSKASNALKAKLHEKVR